jgi:hypothetical protein
MRDREWRPLADPKPFEDATTFRATASSRSEAEQILRTKAERLRRDGVDIEHKFETVPATEAMNVEMEVVLDSLIRARAVAKMTLATLSLRLPDSWLDTPDAARLLSWLRDDDLRTTEGNRLIAAAPVQIPRVMKDLCRPPEHLIVSVPDLDADTVNLWFVLFGKELLPQRVRLYGKDELEIGWAMDPQGRTLDAMSLPELIGRSVVPFDPFREDEEAP